MNRNATNESATEFVITLAIIALCIVASATYYWWLGPGHAVIGFFVVLAIGIACEVYKTATTPPRNIVRQWYNGPVANAVYAVITIWAVNKILRRLGWPTDVTDLLVMLQASKAVAFWVWARIK